MSAEDWLNQCRDYAKKTGTEESFEECVSRVLVLGKDSGVTWHMPFFQTDPTSVEWQAGGMYGSITFHKSQNIWSIHT